jgi:D-alanyl-D-alanine carboxypeptidase
LTLALLATTGGSSSPARQAPGPAAFPFDLKAQLDARVRTLSLPRWQVGIAVRSCARDSLLYGWNQAAALPPASNQKLLVTLCALENWDITLVQHLDTLLDRTPLRSHVHRANRRRTDLLGLYDHPEFPGYRHLVLANRESDNSEAEWMLDWLCRTKRTTAPLLIRSFLDEMDVARPGLRVWDGCGLSHRNRVSAGTLASLLSRTWKSESHALFLSTLAVPGRPGTLVKRPLDAGPHVAAKTGFIRGVFSLSGYLSCRTDTFAFSFLVNNCSKGTPAYDLFNALLNTLFAWDSGERAGTKPGVSTQN